MLLSSLLFILFLLLLLLLQLLLSYFIFLGGGGGDKSQESQGYDNGRDMNDDDFETKKILRMRAILGEGKAHYGSLIEQLIFMEDTQA